MGLLWVLIIGGLAGFIAGKIMRGEGFGVIVDIIVGIVGGWIGSWLLGVLGIWHNGGLISTLVVSILGAIVLIWLIRLIKRA